MKINTANINKLTYLYLILPPLIFILGWLKPLFAIIGVATLAVILWVFFKNEKDREFTISTMWLIIISVVSLIWVWQSGIGSLFYQNEDWHLRNAILQDLINFSFPVRYDNGSYLVYYMGLLLPAAIIGKIAQIFGTSPNTAVLIANVANYLYSSLGIFLIFLQITTTLKAKNKQILAILLLVIFFSGWDIICALVFHQPLGFNLQLEWHGIFQYSSNSTLLFWVYNQTIATWLICTLLFKKAYAIKNFALYAALSLFFAPLPFIGISIYLFCLAIYKFLHYLKHKKLKTFTKNIFSIQNILSLLVLFPIMYFYYKSNTNITNFGLRIYNFNLIIFNFFILEAGIYLMLISYKYYKNILFWITGLSLYIFPFLSLGTDPDLCMRASIPALFILMLFIIKTLLDNQTNKITKIIISIAIIIGSITPILEFHRGIYFTFHKNEVSYIKNDIGSLNNKIKKPCQRVLSSERYFLYNPINYCNYGCTEPNDTIFFKYLAR